MVFLYDLAVPMMQFFSITRYFSPLFLMCLISGDINVSPLNIVLQFLDQRIGKKIFSIDIFHTGFLLEMIVKQQSQYLYFATMITPCRCRNLLALHGAVLR